MPQNPTARNQGSILILAQGLDGGIAPVASLLACGMHHKGHTACIRYIGRPTAQPPCVESDRAQGLDSDAITTGRARSWGEVWGLLRSVITVLRTARQHKPSTIILAGFIPALLYSLPLKLYYRAQLIFWDHAPQNTYLPIKHILFYIPQLLFDRIVSVSPSCTRALTTYFGIPTTKIQIIPNGIACERWISIPDIHDWSHLRILMPARFDLHQKDPLTLIRAVKDLHQRGERVSLTLAGSGIDETRIRTTIAELRLEPFIKLVPATTGIPSLMAEHNVLALSTKFEGLPTVLIEAMLARRPVVASAVAGCVDVVRDGENGYLFAAGDASACAQALLTLRTTAPNKHIIEKAYNECLTRYRPERMISDFIAIIKS